MKGWITVVAVGAALGPAGLLAIDGGRSAGLVAAAAADTTGEAIFKGKGLCHVCHGVDAKGTPLAPDLTDEDWINTDGSLEGIIEIIRTGVSQPKEYPTPMPARGGADLSDEDVEAVAEYVKSLGEGGGVQSGRGD